MWALVTERPSHLLDPRFESWEELLLASLDEVLDELTDDDAALADRTWGEHNRSWSSTPSPRAVPALARWLDMPRADPARRRQHAARAVPVCRGVRALRRLTGSGGAAATSTCPRPERPPPLAALRRRARRPGRDGEPTPFLPGPAVQRPDAAAGVTGPGPSGASMPIYAAKTIVVTGASQGIGRALCLELAPQRPRLVLAARDEAALEQVAAGCRERGAEALVVPDRRHRRRGLPAADRSGGGDRRRPRRPGQQCRDWAGRPSRRGHRSLGLRAPDAGELPGKRLPDVVCPASTEEEPRPDRGGLQPRRPHRGPRAAPGTRRPSTPRSASSTLSASSCAPPGWRSRWSRPTSSSRRSDVAP